MRRKAAKVVSGFLRRVRGKSGVKPPRSTTIVGVGGGDFEKIGQQHKKFFIELGGLMPEHTVLDVGCGVGRMAIPLTTYLSGECEYQGFDIVKSGIDWCQKNISTEFENFHFQHSDIYNKLYNPNGKTLARDYRFPFNDGTFDFVFLTSVFTHMLPADLENYMSEISRVLKPGGKCLITFFLLNEESERLVKSGKSTLDFKYETEGCLTIDEDKPEEAVAYPVDTVRNYFDQYDLKIETPIHYGSWCSRDSYVAYQDMVIATK